MLSSGTHGWLARLARTLTALLVCVHGACAPADRPVLGVALAGSSVDAARLAIRDAEAQGGLPLIDTVVRYERGSEAGLAIALARDLVATPGLIAVVGHSNSPSSLAAAPVYNSAKVLQLAPTSTAVLYSSAGPYSYRMVPPDDQQGTFLAATVHEMFPAGARVALFYVNDDYGRGLRASVLHALARGAYSVPLDIAHVESDFRPEVIAHATRAAKEARPDVVLWLSRSLALHAYLPSLRMALGNTPIIGGDALSTWPQHVQGDERWAGVQHVDFVDLDASVALRAFASRFEAEFGVRPSGADVLTYDAVRVLLAGIKSGANSGPLLRAHLRSLGRSRSAFQGLAGPVAFTEQGEVMRGHLLVTVPPPSVRPVQP